MAFMRMVTRYDVRPLLRARAEDGTVWMFVFHPDDRWAITRNGKEVSTGTGDRASIAAGVEEFLSLTSAFVRSRAARQVAVGELLDRIEHQAAAAGNGCRIPTKDDAARMVAPIRTRPRHNVQRSTAPG